MHTPQDAITEHPKGTVISVQVIPGAKESCLFSSFHPWTNAWECRIQAPAQSGEANRELIQRVAKWFSVPVVSIRILSGKRSGRKLVLIQGITRQSVLESILWRKGDD